MQKNYIIQSQYIPTRDNTRLAATIYFPENKSQIPIVWKHDRYHSNNLSEKETPAFERFKKSMLENGIAVAVVDSRGSGSSFGNTKGPFSPVEQNDMYDVTEWFAEQSWCNKKIGMFGRSYAGISQYLAAASAPPHLKIIAPEMALFDLYAFAYPGGILRHDFAHEWDNNVFQLDQIDVTKNVQEDNDHQLLNQARAEHKLNQDIYRLFSQHPYRNSTLQESNLSLYDIHSPSYHLEKIKASEIAIFHISGWQDLWVKDALIAFNNIKKNQSLMIGPWAHDGYCSFLTQRLVETFVQHLISQTGAKQKLDNMIHYYTIGAMPDDAWRHTETWPLPTVQPATFYLQNQSQITSGLLTEHPNPKQNGSIHYTVDYTTTSGQSSRWANGYGKEMNYDAMEALSKKSVNFISNPFVQAQEITGHPLLEIYLASDQIDFDLFVFLMEIHTDQYLEYITEGCLRASRNQLDKAPYDNFSLPYYPCTTSMIKPVSINETVLYKIDLLPISKIISKNHRIQISICCCDRHNTLTPTKLPEPNITVMCNATYPSQLILPFIP